MNKTLFSAALLVAVSSLHAQTPGLVINEICATANIDQWVDPSFNYGGWVELYNTGTSALTLTNWYLSDDPDHLRKARILQPTTVKAGGYTTLWFDHYKARFSTKTIDMKLDHDGGTLYLSNANGELQLTLDYPEGVARCSWARTTDAGEEWSYCASPTPGKSNAGSRFATERLEAPEVDVVSQVFASGEVNVQVTIPEGCTLRYTIDGTTPSLTQGYTSTTGKLSTKVSRLMRFRLFRDGYLPSPVVSRTFLQNTRNIDLPILSIWSQQSHFYGDSLGIFVKGVNGRAGNGQSSKCNWNMDWERPTVFSYFTPDGEELFSQDVGIERCGGWSRAWSPYSFKLKASKQYEGLNAMDYPFFAEKPYLRSKALQIRNGGNDNGCRILDAAVQQIVGTSGIDIDYQAYQPVAHFVNGVWKGTINLREPNNKHFVYANYGYDDDEIDQFEMSPDSGYCQKCGTYDALDELLTLSQTASNDASYQRITQLLDIEEFCNYMSVELYLRNSDWPQNNLKAWRPRMENGRFRFVLYDLDGTDWTDSPFSTFANKRYWTFDQLYGESVQRYTKEIQIVTLFLNLLKSQQFREQFVNAFCLVTYTVFEPSRCAQIIQQLAQRVAPTQALYNNESPWGTANSLISKFSSGRQEQLMNQLKSYNLMMLYNKTPQKVMLHADTEGARLSINGVALTQSSYEGKLYAPNTVSIAPPAGYTFAGWKQISGTSQTLMARDHQWAYYDRGSLDNTQWKTPGYDDSGWSRGKAPLGYFTGGTRDYNTTLSYGSNSNSKRPTYYFRTHIDLGEAPADIDKFILNYTIDDGFVIYVNGIEAGRYNMPSGVPTYNTYARTYAENNPDSGTMLLDATLFQAGANTIAVEIHNNSANSTDVYWSAQLTHTHVMGSELVCATPNYELPASGDVELLACFEPDASAQHLAPVRINEVSANNGIYINDLQKKADWIELYNRTDQEIDLQGLYLTDDASRPDKWMITADAGASTLIPAHGYRIIWCDGKEGRSQLHAPFKLGNVENGQVILSAPDMTWHDTLTYCPQEPDQTVGRYPDGGDQVYLLTRTTIDRPNLLSMLSQPYDQPHEDSIEQILSDDLLHDEYAIYDLSGRFIEQGHGAVSTLLPPGIYLVKAGGTARKVMVR